MAIQLHDSERSVDEYRLVIHPVAIGHGTTLPNALDARMRLDLLEARTFPSGTAIYVHRQKERSR